MKTTSTEFNILSPDRKPSFADEIRAIDMKWIWGAVLVVILIVLGVLRPVQALSYVLEAGGVAEEGAQALGMVAGFTFPMTLGFSVIMFALVSGIGLPERLDAKLFAGACVLFVSGLIGKVLGWGLQPAYGPLPHGPIWVMFPAFVADAYFSSYGFPLSLCSFLIGTALAIQVERLHYKVSGLSG